MNVQRFGPMKQSSDVCKNKHECGFQTCLAYAMSAAEHSEPLNKCSDYKRYQK